MLAEWVEAVSDILHAHAVNLARNGRYLQAESVLELLIVHEGPSARSFALLGKIYAQQGRYGEAIAQWQKALGIELENKDALKAIKRAEEMLQMNNVWIG